MSTTHAQHFRSQYWDSLPSALGAGLVSIEEMSPIVLSDGFCKDDTLTDLQFIVKIYLELNNKKGEFSY